MEAADATTAPTRDKPASNKRNTAAVVAKAAVKTPLIVGFWCRAFSRFFLPNNIFNGQKIVLVLSGGGFQELRRVDFIYREVRPTCTARAYPMQNDASDF